MLAILLVPVVALILGVAAPGVWAEDDDDDGDGPITLDEAKIIIETNFTDGDAGIQVFLDGEAWKKIRIIDPNGKKVLNVKGKGNLKNFGLTELFLESEEPNFSEMPLLDILTLFPEGDYKFKGKSVEGDKLEGTATLSHNIPCGPENLMPEEETVDISADDVIISWDQVTNMLNNDDEDCTGEAIAVGTYQVIVEDLDTGNEFSIHLPALNGGNQVTLPEEFIEDGKTYKYEVLAIADNGNQTIAETWFCTGNDSAECDEPED
jgi:hypothetical protein